MNKVQMGISSKKCYSVVKRRPPARLQIREGRGCSADSLVAIWRAVVCSAHRSSNSLLLTEWAIDCWSADSATLSAGCSSQTTVHIWWFVLKHELFAFFLSNDYSNFEYHERIPTNKMPVYMAQSGLGSFNLRDTWRELFGHEVYWKSNRVLGADFLLLVVYQIESLTEKHLLGENGCGYNRQTPY